MVRPRKVRNWARNHRHSGGQMISEFDARQLRKVKLQLAAFQRGELSLADFIGDIDFLLNAMEDIPLEWKQRVHEFVVILEEVYAVALDVGHTEIDEQGRRFVAEAIEGIYRCLEEVQIPEERRRPRGRLTFSVVR